MQSTQRPSDRSGDADGALGEPGGAPAERDQQTGPLSADAARRRFLSILGGGALSTALAGCSLLTQQSLEFTATPVGLDESSRSDHEFDEVSRSTITVERSESVGEFEGEVTVNSQVAIYSSERDTEPLDVEGLWQATDSVLAGWSDGAPVAGIQADAVVDGETMPAQATDFGASELPAAAAQVWVPTPKFASPSPSDVLVAVPNPHFVPNPKFGDRPAHRFAGNRAVPPGTALTFGEETYVSGQGAE